MDLLKGCMYVLFKGITNFECKRVVFCYCISLQRKAFSILHIYTLTLFIFYPPIFGYFFFFFSTPSNILYISIYIRFQFHFIRSPILMDSLRWWIYEIRLINIPFATSTQPDGSFSPILLGIFVFGKKEENIKREKYWCWVLFSCFLFVMCVPKTKYLYPKIFLCIVSSWGYQTFVLWGCKKVLNL